MLSYIIYEDFPKTYLVSTVAKFCPTLVTPWTVAYQAPLFMGCSRWEYWSGLPFLSSEDLPNPGIEPASPALQADSLSLSHWGKPMFSHSGGIVLYFCKSTSALIVSWILICFRCVPWCYITHHVTSGKLHHTLIGEWKWKGQITEKFCLCVLPSSRPHFGASSCYHDGELRSRRDLEGIWFKVPNEWAELVWPDFWPAFLPNLWSWITF